MLNRRKTRQVQMGSVAVGGDAPVSVQTMTKTDTRDISATISQIHEVQALGCDIVRLAVVDEVAAKALAEIKKETNVPLVADIHFDYKLALVSLESGVDALRINPGNIGDKENVRKVVEAVREKKIPIRIGVNSGSLERDIADKYGSSTPEALVESAMRHVAILEDMDYEEIIISAKASDVLRTLATYRLLSKKTDYPLHVGVTEAGTLIAGTIRSSVAMGTLLAEGIGDTLRVSLTDSPAKEVKVGLELLRSLGLREAGSSVVSCPTCGRIAVDVVGMANSVEEELEKYYAENPDAPKPLVAVMGCMVNGPGEAKEADIAIAGGKGKFALYIKGKQVGVIPESEALNAVLEQVKKWEKA